MAVHSVTYPSIYHLYPSPVHSSINLSIHHLYHPSIHHLYLSPIHPSSINPLIHHLYHPSIHPSSINLSIYHLYYLSIHPSSLSPIRPSITHQSIDPLSLLPIHPFIISVCHVSINLSSSLYVYEYPSIQKSLLVTEISPGRFTVWRKIRVFPSNPRAAMTHLKHFSLLD